MQQERRARYGFTASGAANNVILTMNEWSIVPKEMTILSSAGMGLGVTYVRTVATDPVEGIGLPKMLEEKVKHDTFHNTSMYAIDPNGQIDKTATYNVIEIEAVFLSGYSTNPTINGSRAGKSVQYQIWVNSDIVLDDQDVLGTAYNTANKFWTDAAAAIAGGGANFGTEAGYAEDDSKVYVA